MTSWNLGGVKLVDMKESYAFLPTLIRKKGVSYLTSQKFRTREKDAGGTGIRGTTTKYDHVTVKYYDSGYVRMRTLRTATNPSGQCIQADCPP